MAAHGLAPPPSPLEATAGRLGLAIPLQPFRQRLGGEAALRKVLSALTVVEKVHAGRPRGMGRATRKAYTVERAAGRETLVLPRAKGAAFLRARTKGGTPLLDRVVAAPAGSPNAPLAAPRLIPAERCVLAQPLYPYQAAAVDHLCGDAGPLGPAAVAEHRGVAYGQMDTGLGKSRVGFGVIARRREPALVVVPTDAIAGQWVEEGREVCPDLRVEVYRNPARGSRRTPPGPATHDVVVVIINTFREKPPEFLDGYGTVILDEAHEYHSPCNSRALWLAQTNAVLGLSATPFERPDGLDRLIPLHLGPVIYPAAIPGFDAGAVRFRGETRVVEYAGHPRFCETALTPAGTMSAILTVSRVLQDPARLRLVAAEVGRLARLHAAAEAPELRRLGLGPRPAADADAAHPAGEVRRHGIFVFAELREYLPALRAALAAELGADAAVYVPELDSGAGPDQKAEAEAKAEAKAEGRGDAGELGAAAHEDKKEPRGGAEPAPISILRGGVPQAAVGQARRAGAHVVLTTYGFSRRGISLPDMTAIVLASPRRHGLRQVLGRARRRGSDESILRQVVDIVDVCTGLRGQAADRRKVYAAMEYPVARVAAAWGDYATGTELGGDAAVAGADGAPADGTAAALFGDEALAAEDDLGLLSTDELLAMALGPSA